MLLPFSETEMAKLFYPDSRSEIGSEAEKMKFTNGVNGLVAKFIRLDYHEKLHAAMLVMGHLSGTDF